jgi:hypothetical protein
MRTTIKTILAAIMITAGTLWVTSCQKESITPSGGVNDVDVVKSNSQNSLVFPPQANMYGKSYAQWSAEWWKWDLQFDCDHFPTRDVDGSLENQNQSGPVYFLAGKRMPFPGGGTRIITVTIPAGVSLFFPLATVENEYPCVDVGEPAPGQTVEQLLTSLAVPFADAIDQLSLTVDGISVGNLSGYKVISPMFTTSANADLANCFDGCLSGTPQQFVAASYFIMLKPLSPGTHIVHRVGGASSIFPFTFDIEYDITQL